MAEPLTPEQRAAMALTMASAYVHFTTFASIETKSGVMERAPKATKFQTEILQAYEWLVSKNRPVRIIAAPKARQSGGSTIVGHICYHHTRRFHCHGMMMADESSRTLKIWQLFQRFAANDPFAHFWDSAYEGNTEVCRFRYQDEDGTARVAEWEKETANDPKAGAAGTRRVLWFSECMRYKREGDAADTKVIANAINSMPLEAGTVVFLESTAEGPGGYAYGIYQEAATLREVVTGKTPPSWNGWVKVFCAWHDCADYQLDAGRPEHAGWFNDADERFASHRSREQAGVRLYGWTAGQIAWRRQKIVGDKIGIELFDRDFPESPEVAFSSSAHSRFDADGVARMLVEARDGHKLGRRGVLHENVGVLRFMPDEHNGFLWMIEPPEEGRSYCIFADPMEGEQSMGEASTLDCHAVGVLREAYRDVEGVEWPDEVVAVFDAPNGVRWELAVLAERIRQLSAFYGKCNIVPESNNSGAALIILLKLAGLDVYRRQTPDAINPNKTVKASGFRTTSRTKPQWIEALATAITEETLRCRYLPAVRELPTFVRKPDGTCSAASGKHDDWVAAIAIAVLCRVFTRMHKPEPFNPFGPQTGSASPV